MLAARASLIGCHGCTCTVQVLSVRRYLFTVNTVPLLIALYPLNLSFFIEILLTNLLFNNNKCLFVENASPKGIERRRSHTVQIIIPKDESLTISESNKCRSPLHLNLKWPMNNCSGRNFESIIRENTPSQNILQFELLNITYLIIMFRLTQSFTVQIKAIKPAYDRQLWLKFKWSVLAPS